jgi:hypothetical protein
MSDLTEVDQLAAPTPRKFRYPFITGERIVAARRNDTAEWQRIARYRQPAAGVKCCHRGIACRHGQIEIRRCCQQRAPQQALRLPRPMQGRDHAARVRDNDDRADNTGRSFLDRHDPLPAIEVAASHRDDRPDPWQAQGQERLPMLRDVVSQPWHDQDCGLAR